MLRSRDAGSLDVWLNDGIRKLGSIMPFPTSRVASKPCQTALNAALSAKPERLKQIDSPGRLITVGRHFGLPGNDWVQAPFRNCDDHY